MNRPALSGLALMGANEYKTRLDLMQARRCRGGVVRSEAQANQHR